MLTTVGQGVVLNALLGLGFRCTQDDFDLARLERFFAHTERSPHLLKVDVTHLIEVQEQPLEAVPPVGLTPALSWLHHQLSKVNCHFDAAAFRRDANEAVFVRHDIVNSPHWTKPMTTKVIVRARVERAPQTVAIEA